MHVLTILHAKLLKTRDSHLFVFKPDYIKRPPSQNSKVLLFKYRSQIQHFKPNTATTSALQQFMAYSFNESLCGYFLIFKVPTAPFFSHSKEPTTRINTHHSRFIVHVGHKTPHHLFLYD